MRAVVSLVRSCLVGIGVFAAMTLSLCVALAIAISGPPTKSELADLRTLIAETLRGLGPAGQDDVKQAPVEHAEVVPAPEPPPNRAPRRERSPLLDGPQNASPAPQVQRAEPAWRGEPRLPRPPALQAERSAARPPPAIDSRAAQIARAAEELLSTLPPSGKHDPGETEVSAALDPGDEVGQEAPQSYEEWAETWTPFGPEEPGDKPAPDAAGEQAP